MSNFSTENPTYFFFSFSEIMMVLLSVEFSLFLFCLFLNTAEPDDSVELKSEVEESLSSPSFVFFFFISVLFSLSESLSFFFEKFQGFL